MKLLLQIFKTMKKILISCVDKALLSTGKILIKQSNGLISVIRTLLRRKQRLRGGMLTLNAVVQTQMILNTQVTQIRQMSRKTPKKLYKLVLADRKLKLREIAEDLKCDDTPSAPRIHQLL